MQAGHQTRVAVAGRDSIESLRLADLLREIIGRENVFRHLETEHLLKFLEEHAHIPIVVFVDIFSFDLQHVTKTIGEFGFGIRKLCSAFTRTRMSGKRGRRSFPAIGQTGSAITTTSTRCQTTRSSNPLSGERSESPRGRRNTISDTSRSASRSSDAGVAPYSSPEDRLLGAGTVFVSYARSDWDGAISPLIPRLRQAGFQLWVDQAFLVGGEDWMDDIGEALIKAASACWRSVPTR